MSNALRSTRGKLLIALAGAILGSLVFMGTSSGRVASTGVCPGIDPIARDSDEDRLLNAKDSDDDNDGLTTVFERDSSGTCFLAADTDGDQLEDADELAGGTDPMVADMDNDGWTDGYEKENGSDPTKPESTPLSASQPAPEPSPTPSGSPEPSPTPSGSPSPTPSGSPTPSPSPSPTGASIP
ncbi:MAG: hypothetical protein ACRDHM_02230 [Actinomycetota bacterium]